MTGATIKPTQCAPPVLRFVGRVAPIHGESLMSLVARACEANVFERVSDVLAFAGVHGSVAAYAPFTGVDRADDLAALLSVEPEHIHSRMHPRADEGALLPAVEWFGMRLERRFIEAVQRRVSPTALRRSPHHRAAWMVRPLSFCPETLEYLLSSCQACNRQLGWTHTRGIAKCEHCDAWLLDRETARLAPELVEDAQLAAALVSVSASDRLNALSSLPEPFASWGPADVFTAIFELGVAWTYARSEATKEDAVRLGRGEFAAFKPEALVLGVQALRNWPSSLTPLVQLMWEAAPSNGSTALHAWMGPLSKFVRKRATPTPFQRVFSENVSDVVRYARIPVKSSALTTPSYRKERSEISEREAIELFGTTQKVLRRLDGNGQALLVRRNRVAKLYDRAALTNSFAELGGSVPGNACALDLGVPAYCLEAMASEGLLSAVDDHDALLMAGGGALFATASVAELKAKLEAAVGHRRGHVPLSEAMIGVLAPSAWAKVVSAIARGTLPSSCRELSQKPLSDRLQVDPSATLELLTGVDLSNYPGEAVINTMSAARILGTSDILVGKAVLAGLIPAITQRRRHSIALRDIAMFMERFVLTREIARRLGCSHEIARDQLVAAGLTPAAIVHGLSLWDRSQAEPVVGLNSLRLWRRSSETRCSQSTRDQRKF